MVIKHIVISGGGPTGLLSYGAAKHLAQQGVWQHDTIETIYGTSIGSLLGAMLCLKHEWSTLDDYIVKRPWEKVIADSLEMFEMFSSCKGMANLKLIDDIMQPLLESKDLTLGVTLREFHEHSRISLNVFTVDLNTFTPVQLSHTTHPTLPLMDAIKMSSCVPVLFRPMIRDGCCYVDGGIMVNYPLRECLDDTRCSPDEVLGLRNIWSNPRIHDGSTMLEYLRFINLQLTRLVNKHHAGSCTAAAAASAAINEVVCHVKPDITPAEWFSIMSDAGQRLAWIEDGVGFGKAFIQAQKNDPAE